MASITKRPDGSWRARYRDETGREHSKHFARKADGQRWLDEVTAAVVTGQYVDPGVGRVTFDRYFTEWAERQVWVPSTAQAADLVRRSVPFGDVPLMRLRTSHLEGWVKAMDSSGLAATTVASRMNTARACLKAAVRDRFIAADPSVGVRLPRRRRAEHSMRVPTPDEVGAVLALTVPYMRPVIAVAAFGGLRLGEACAVQACDVDFLRRQLKVQRQVQRRKGGGVDVRPPKYGSERTVHLPDGVLAILAHHLETYGVAEGGWLVVSPEGLPIPPTTANGWWHRTLAAAGLEGVRFHDLRHFYASGLIAAGCDVVTVQRALGHSAATTTLNTYSHLWPTAEDRTRSAAASLFIDATTPSARSDRALAEPSSTAGAPRTTKRSVP